MFQVDRNACLSVTVYVTVAGMNNTAPDITVHTILAAARSFYRNVWREPDMHRPDRYDLELIVLNRLTESAEWLDWRYDTSATIRAEVQS